MKRNLIRIPVLYIMYLISAALFVCILIVKFYKKKFSAFEDYAKKQVLFATQALIRTYFIRSFINYSKYVYKIYENSFDIININKYYFYYLHFNFGNDNIQLFEFIYQKLFKMVHSNKDHATIEYSMHSTKQNNFTRTVARNSYCFVKY